MTDHLRNLAGFRFLARGRRRRVPDRLPRAGGVGVRRGRAQEPRPRAHGHESRGNSPRLPARRRVPFGRRRRPALARATRFGIACAGRRAADRSRTDGGLSGRPGRRDQFLFPAALEREALRAGRPNRMSPNTAAAFVLVGLALTMLDARTRRRGTRPAQLLALATGLIALLALIGYAYSAASLIGVNQFIPMALNTAIAFAILSVGILCARPDRGVMAVVSGTAPAGSWQDGCCLRRS